MTEHSQTMYSLWQGALDKHSKDEFLKIPIENNQVLNYQFGTFYRRAIRIANAFHIDLKCAEGERVAILTGCGNDLALLYHGLWLGRFVVAPVELGLPIDYLCKYLNEIEATVVVFPPEGSAKIASLFSKVPSVRSWVVTGKSSHLGQSSGMKKLDELIMQATAELPAHCESEKDGDALIVMGRGTTGDPVGVKFSHHQLVAASKIAAQASAGKDPVQDKSALSWSTLSWKGLNGLMFTFIAPLISGIPVLVNADFEMRKFWEHLQSDGITTAVISQEDLRTITRRGKGRVWVPPASLNLLVLSHSVLSSSLFATFEKRFNVAVRSCYSITEAGGIVSVFPSNQTPEYVDQWLYDYDVPSSGVPVKGVEIVVCDLSGAELEDQVLGEIWVKASHGMSGYASSSGKDTELGEDGFLRTGDEGFIAIDENGKSHVFVVGRVSELIDRNNVRVSPSRIDNELFNIRGIDYACAVGFPNVATGYEIGAYVIANPAARLNEKDLLRLLREQLDWSECPKVILFGKRLGDEDPPSREQVAPLFDQFYDVNFNQPDFND